MIPVGKKVLSTFLSNRVHPDVSERFIDARQDMIDAYLSDLFD